MTTLVTGANGLIGAHVVRALLGEGRVVRALTRAAGDRSSLDGLAVETVTGDVLDAGTVRAAAGGCEVVIHTAVPFAYTGQVDDDVGRVAVEGTANVLRAAWSAGARRVVVTSSSIVFGGREAPVNVDESAGLIDPAGHPGYVVAKVRQDAAALQLAAALDLDVVLVCPTMSMGPFGSRLTPSNAVIVQYLADPLRLTYPGGINVVDVADVGRGHVLAADAGRPGAHYLLGGQDLTFAQVHAIIAELAGVAPPRFALTRASAYLAATAEEQRARLGRRRPLTTRDQAVMAGRFYWYDSSRAVAELGYRSRPAREALARAIAWLAASPHVTREMRAAMHLHADVVAARRQLAADESRLRVRVA